MKPFRYIISGGGTGGHIYPAIAIADAIKERDPKAEIIFVGAHGKMEMEKVPQAGYRIHGLWISGLQRKQFSRNLLFPLKLMVSLFQALFLWLRYRPAIMIGTGGYASGPMLFVGSLMGSLTLIQEQNSYPGITNKLLAKRVNMVAVAYEGMERYFPTKKIFYTGNPIREDMFARRVSKRDAFHHYSLDPAKKVLVVIGGSLGAQALNEMIASRISFFEDQDVQVLWQCGRLYYDRYEGINSPNITLFDFVREMDLFYAAADVIISRAGASSISELCVVGKPTLFIPSPNVSENHQYHNANQLATCGAAIMIQEKEIEERFEQVFQALINDEKQLFSLGERLRRLGKPNATQDILECIEVLKLSYV